MRGVHAATIVRNGATTDILFLSMPPLDMQERKEFCAVQLVFAEPENF
jgi:hypothetical protein